jgi:methylenetetrahydrofolate reductase (NADPH)
VNAVAQSAAGATARTPRATRVQHTKTVRELLEAGQPSFSFEFFPPKTDEGERQLWQAIRELEPYAPTFVSVTYGAGGSSRDRTIRVTERIATQTTLTPVAHLTAVGHSVAELRRVVGDYAGAGIRNVLALRGDPPGGPSAPWVQHPEGLEFASDLVQLVRSLGDFCVGVAAFPDKHPGAADLEVDARRLVTKCEAGADFAITQFFFSADAYFRLRDRIDALGCNVPILPGIMPITQSSSIQKMAEMSGALFPPELARRLADAGDDPLAVRAIGVEVGSALATRLLAGGAPGLHFYTMNRSTASREIFASLGRSGTGHR